MTISKLSLLAMSAVLATTANAAPPPISLYGQLPNIGTIRLSPNGDRWAAIMGDDTTQQAQVRATADNRLAFVSTVGKGKLRNLLWVDDDHLVATVSDTENVTAFYNGRQEWFQLLAADLAQPKGWVQLLRGIPSVIPVAAGEPVAIVRDGKPGLVVPGLRLAEDYTALALVEPDLNAKGGRALAQGASNMLYRKGGFVVAEGNAHTIDWHVGSDGRPLARVDYNSKSGVWDLWLRQNGALKKVYTEQALIDAPYLVSFARAADTLLMASHKSGAWENYEVKLTDGSVTGPAKNYDADRIILDPVSRIVIGTKDITLSDVVYNFDAPADQSLWRRLTKAFPGQLVELIDWNADRSRVVVEVTGPAHGDAMFLVDRKAGKADVLAQKYTGLGPEQMSPVTTLTYKAGDGMEIPAYLTLPRDRPAKALPLIVMPHGGPHSRDYPGFDWWAQALASRGYAVLQPQFRGSSGFGEAFEAAGYGQWGRKMQTDLSDGVKYLAAQGTIDAKRVCVAGASYGGYAAMAGVSVEQGVYRCASAVAGVSDLRRMLETQRIESGSKDNASMRFWQRYMGASGIGDTSVDAVSPARLADRVKVPLQLIHGKDDTRVLLEQSRLMADAMKRANKPVDFIILPGEHHFLSKPATRIAMLEAPIAFLERHNPPDPPPASPAP